jgi:hypothetical protein
MEIPPKSLVGMALVDFCIAPFEQYFYFSEFQNNFPNPPKLPKKMTLVLKGIWRFFKGNRLWAASDDIFFSINFENKIKDFW